jgi:phosphatidate cytidylyltransferase
LDYKLNELKKRIAVALIGIPVAIGLIFLGSYYFSLAIIILALYAVSEYNSFVKFKTENIQYFSSNLFTLSLLLIFSLLQKPSDIAFALILLNLLMVLIIYGIQVIRGKVKDSLISVSVVINSVFYIGAGFSSLIIIRNFNLYLLHWRDYFNQSSYIYGISFADTNTWGLIVFFIFLAIWSCDSFAYFIGKSFGKHKMHPNVSPKKSWEGAIAGLLGSVLIFSILTSIYIPEIPLVHSLLIGILIGITGQIGDLAESLLKRDVGVKDSSNLLPGHGGILDRFDSVLFVFPVLVIYFFLVAAFF